MDVSNIKLTDLQRILVGDAPYVFLVEVVFRTLFIYFLLLVTIRLMGKRMSGQLSLTEMAVIIALGAIVSVPAQVPDRGILPGALLLLLILAFQRGIALAGVKSRRAETIAQGKSTLIIKDGILQLGELADAKITREQLFGLLRSQEIMHLGMIKRVYLEASGNFSIYRQDVPRPGLSVLPRTDTGLTKIQQHPDSNLEACFHCGNTEKAGPAGGGPHTCRICGSNTWETVVK